MIALTEDHVLYQKYLGEGSWVKVCQVSDNQFIVYDNQYECEFVAEAEFETLDSAIDYAQKVC